MSIATLFTSVVGVSCGICCFKNLPCEKCLGDTLRANGISLDFIDKFRGLANKNHTYQYPFEYSELANALREHRSGAPEE